MSLTLKQQIDADTSPVFLQTDEFAEDVTHYPAGNFSAPATVQAVVDRDEEASGGVGSGEGADFDNANRVRLRRNAILELAASVVVTERSGTQQANASLWEFDGFRWTTVRILSRDDSMQSVLVSRSDKIATRRLERERMVDQGEMLAVLLATTAAWQALTGAGSVAAALAFTHQFQAEDAGAQLAPYPRAVISETEEERRIHATASFTGGGAMLLGIEALVPDAQATSVQTERDWFVDQVRTLREQMLVLSASRATPAGYTHSHLQVRNISWAVEPFRVDIEEREDQALATTIARKPLWAVQFRVEY